MTHISINSERYYSLNEGAMAFGLDAHDLEYFCKNGLIQSRRIGGRWHVSESALRQYAAGKEMAEPEPDEAEVQKVHALTAADEPEEKNDSEDSEEVLSPVLVAPRGLRTKVGTKRRSSRASVNWGVVAAVLVLGVMVGGAVIKPEVFAYALHTSLSAVAAVGATASQMTTWAIDVFHR